MNAHTSTTPLSGLLLALSISAGFLGIAGVISCEKTNSTSAAASQEKLAPSQDQANALAEDIDDGRESERDVSDGDTKPPDTTDLEQSEQGRQAKPRPVQPRDTASTASSTWTSFRGNPNQTGVASGSIPDNPSLLWSYTTGGAIVSSPVVADGRLYFGSDDGNIYCLDAKSGDKIWAYPTQYIIEAPPMIHKGVCYVGSHDFFFYALDAVTGELKWKYETYEKVIGGANIVLAPDGVTEWIVIGSHDAFIYALDAQTGEKQWEYETNDRVNGTPAVVNNQIVFGGCDTAVYALDGATGKPSAKIELGGECYIAASVGIADDTVYVGHHADEFLTIDLKTKAIGWRYPFARSGIYSAPAITADRVLFGGRDKRLHCVDRKTGEPVWTFPTRRKIDAAPVVCGNRVVVGSGDGRLYMVNLQDGTQVWSHDVGKSIFSSAAIEDGMIYVGSNDGNLYAFGEAEAQGQQDSS